MTETYRNRDQELLHRFRAEPGPPLAIDTSPFSLSLKMHVSGIDLENQRVELTFEPGEQYLQGANVLQGGIVSAMIDYAMAFAGLAMLPANKLCATTTLNVGFLKAAKPGAYVATGEIERIGRQVIFTRGSLARRGEAPAATASSTLTVF